MAVNDPTVITRYGWPNDERARAWGGLQDSLDGLHGSKKPASVCLVDPRQESLDLLSGAAVKHLETRSPSVGKFDDLSTPIGLRALLRDDPICFEPGENATQIACVH